jgi:hypothetical protein
MFATASLPLASNVRHLKGFNCDKHHLLKSCVSTDATKLKFSLEKLGNVQHHLIIYNCLPSVHVFKTQYHFGSVELHLILVKDTVLQQRTFYYLQIDTNN